MSEHAPARSQLVSLLFAGADDPVRALRWGLAEIRRALGDDGSVKGTAAFETWLLAQQRRAAAASEAILHEAALRPMARGALGEAAGYAVRAATMSPLDVQAAIREPRYVSDETADEATIEAVAGLLEQAATLSQAAGEPRRQAYSLSMLGRVSLFRGALDTAASQLDASIELAERDHWLAFLPWPQDLRGEVQRARADPAGAAGVLRHAFARACQLGDPCWEGMSARGLALVAEAEGDTERPFELLADARTRCNRLADPYLWLDVYILDAQCELGLRHGHADVSGWVETMRNLASRMGMRELALRSLRHGAALGYEGDSAAAAVLADEIGARL